MGGYYFFDTPTNQDCFKKMWFTTKYGTLAGLVVSFHDIVLVSHPKDLFQGVTRVARFTLPAAAMGATFSAVTCSLATARKKDDELNYVIGGLLAGSVWGAARRSVAVGIGWSVVSAVVGLLLKAGHDEGWDPIPSEIHRRDFGPFYHYSHDFTILTDPKDQQK